MPGDPTKFATLTLAEVLNAANPGQIADALRQVGLGTILAPLKVTFSGLTGAAAQNITTAAAKAAATINQGLPGPLDVGAPLVTLPPILAVVALRITAGTANQNPCIVGDSGTTGAALLNPVAPGISVAALSDDGTTLTFGAAVTGFVLEYIPRSANDPMGTQFIPTPKA